MAQQSQQFDKGKGKAWSRLREDIATFSAKRSRTDKRVEVDVEDASEHTVGKVSQGGEDASRQRAHGRQGLQDRHGHRPTFKPNLMLMNAAERRAAMKKLGWINPFGDRAHDRHSDKRDDHHDNTNKGDDDDDCDAHEKPPWLTREEFRAQEEPEDQNEPVEKETFPGSIETSRFPPKTAL